MFKVTYQGRVIKSFATLAEAERYIGSMGPAQAMDYDIEGPKR